MSLRGVRGKSIKYKGVLKNMIEKKEKYDWESWFIAMGLGFTMGILIIILGLC